MNLDPKALGLTLPPGNLFWEEKHQRLCILAGGGRIAVARAGILAARRQKM